MVVASPSAIERLPDSGRFVALDSLRGFAAIGVAMLHSLAANGIAQWPIFRHGSLFVDFFFVLSGFVIAASYGERIAAGFPVRRFMLLRLGRVYPLHIVMVAAFVALECAAAAFGSYGLNPHAPFGGDHEPFRIVRAIFLLDGYFPDRGNFYNGVSWSISVELALYLLAALAFRAGKVGLLAYGAAGILAWVMLTRGWDEPLLTSSILRGIAGFTTGIGCWLLYQRGLIATRFATVLEVAAVAIVVGMITYIISFGMWWPVIYLAFALTVWVFSAESGAVSRLLRTRIPVWLGTISYSIYMVHGFVLGRAYDVMQLTAAVGGPQLLRFYYDGAVRKKEVALSPIGSSLVVLALLCLVLLVSHLTWRWIEEPARQWSRRKAAQFGAGAEERVAPTL